MRVVRRFGGARLRFPRRSLSSTSSTASTASSPDAFMESLVQLCKTRGFVMPSAEVYGGSGGFFDFGPLGTQLRKNIRDSWWRDFVERDASVMGVETPVLVKSKVWQHAGHLEHFHDPLVTCGTCQHRQRADHLIPEGEEERIDVANLQSYDAAIAALKPKCPSCGSCNWSETREFNLMFKSLVGAVADASNDDHVAYLRPETAQGTFLTWPHVSTIARKELPFGLAQMGRAFRNELNVGPFLFRGREFEQMELEWFCEPETDHQWYRHWIDRCMKWLTDHGVAQHKLRLVEHSPDKLSHYSTGTTDIEFEYPFGWGELWGVAKRTDYDLRQHEEGSGKAHVYRDPHNASVTRRPFVVEPAVGLDRLMLAVLASSYRKEVVAQSSGKKAEERVVLGLHARLAPVKVAVLPLMKKPALVEVAQRVHKVLCDSLVTDYDASGSVGRRYRRQDEAGTPHCVTVDFESLEDQCVTVRDRDTMNQTRVPINDVVRWIREAQGCDQW